MSHQLHSVVNVQESKKQEHSRGTDLVPVLDTWEERKIAQFAKLHSL